MRETRTQLREKHKSRLQEEYLEKAAIVKQVIHDSIYREGEATGAIPYGGSPMDAAAMGSAPRGAR